MQKKQYLIKIIWWIYIILLIGIVVFKFRGSFSALSVKIAATPFGTNYNLVPFRSIMEQLSQFSEGWAKFNLLGNIIPFMPFGFLLPIIYPKLRTFKQVFVCSLICILLIEVLQFFTRLGSFDIDDIILNMIGILCGWLLLSLIRKKQLGRKNSMTNEKVYAMSFAKVYPMLIAKAEKKGRTKAEVLEITSWLTGYTAKHIEDLLQSDICYGDFFLQAPLLNPDRKMIKGTVCGVRVENIEEPLMQEIRYLDKLIDELAKGKAMDKILRKQA